jgi:hypothetical protein
MTLIFGGSFVSLLGLFLCDDWRNCKSIATWPHYWRRRRNVDGQRPPFLHAILLHCVGDCEATRLHVVSKRLELQGESGKRTYLRVRK